MKVTKFFHTTILKCGYYTIRLGSEMPWEPAKFAEQYSGFLVIGQTNLIPIEDIYDIGVRIELPEINRGIV